MDITADPTIQQLVGLVTGVTGITEEQLKSHRKMERIVAARVLLAALVHKYTGYTVSETYPLFNHTEHSTVLYYRKVHKTYIAYGENPNFVAAIPKMYSDWFNKVCDMIDAIGPIPFYNSNKKRKPWGARRTKPTTEPRNTKKPLKQSEKS